MVSMSCLLTLGVALAMPTVADGYVDAYAIVLKDHPQKCLDLQGGDTTNGNTLQIWDCNDKHTQGWIFKDNRMVFRGNREKCVDLRKGDVSNGNKIQIWDCNWGSAPNQEWTYESGELGIKHTASEGEKCIDLPNGRTTNGWELQLWDCDGSAGQQWVLASQWTENTTTPWVITVVLLSIVLVLSIAVNCAVCFMRRQQDRQAKTGLKSPTGLAVGQPTGELEAQM